MDELLDYAFSKRQMAEPNNEEPPFEDADVLMRDLMRALNAPDDFSADDLIELTDTWASKQETRERVSLYVDRRLSHPEWSFDQIRQELQVFADSCDPPITHMQARTLAFIEKRKRAEKGNMAARCNLVGHQERRWRLPENTEQVLWLWVAERWGRKFDAERSGYANLAEEMRALAARLGATMEAVRAWVKGVLMCLSKMQQGKVRITGMPVKLIVRAAVDDTPA